MSTNYQKVKEFHQTFELAVSNEFHNNILDNEKLLNLRVSLIDEELNELKEAIKNKDKKEVVDALTDILYVVYGAGVSFGVDLDKSFDLVHKSNMSKACISLEEAKATVEQYKKEGRYDTPSYKEKDGKYVIYNESTGKILKSMNYKPVNLESFI